MTDSARHIIEEFHALPETDRQEVLAALLREALSSGYSTPDDDTLTRAADGVFLEFDRRESE